MKKTSSGIDLVPLLHPFHCMLGEKDIEKRKPVWMALSELWLDTELTEDDLGRIARVLAESKLSLEELEEIYRREVAPVVYLNLLTTAGEWAGFDKEWLCSSITRNLEKNSLWGRYRSKFFLTRKLMFYATDRHWEKLVGYVHDLQKPSPK